MENRDMKDKMNFELLLIPCYSETQQYFVSILDIIKNQPKPSGIYSGIQSWFNNRKSINSISLLGLP